jgi:hypothetical protein
MRANRIAGARMKSPAPHRHPERGTVMAKKKANEKDP